MKIPKKARYGYCVKKACEFLEEFEINSYPIDVISLINRQKWGLTAYSELMELYNCDRDTVCRCLRSIDGYSQQDADNVSIAYNDDASYGDRIRFTLMHEIGHIYLKHFIDFDLTLLHREPTVAEYKVLENEANAFARNVLAPISMVNQLKDKSFENVSHSFGITHDASVTRVSLLPNDSYYLKQQNLTHRMTGILFKFYTKTVCRNCNAFFYTRHRKYCPICGSKNTLEWGNGNKMEYPLLETYQNGKLAECPVCKNEETDIEGDFCQICGTNLVNKCSDNCHSEPLPSNARYCPICGEKSTFYTLGILSDWNKKPKQNTGFIDFPVFDEELPFN